MSKEENEYSFNFLKNNFRSMTSCPNCGVTVSDTAKFCEACGSSLPGTTPTPEDSSQKRSWKDTLKKMVKWTVIGIVGMFLFLLILGLILNATAPPPNCGPVYCKPPNQCCNNTCYNPCEAGSFMGKDCRCHVNGSFQCGSGYCEPEGECCKGTCYTKIPPGYVRTGDCTMVPIGSELCDGQYFAPCPEGYFRADNCACTPDGAWLCKGQYYTQCSLGFEPSYTDCTCMKSTLSFTGAVPTYDFSDVEWAVAGQSASQSTCVSMPDGSINCPQFGGNYQKVPTPAIIF